MDLPFDDRFNSSSQLLRYTGGLGLLPCHPQEALRYEAPPSLSQDLPRILLLSNGQYWSTTSNYWSNLHNKI